MGGVPATNGSARGITSTLVPSSHSHGFTQQERLVRYWNPIP
jgi:hypothetical protein